VAATTGDGDKIYSFWSAIFDANADKKMLELPGKTVELIWKCCRASELPVEFDFCRSTNQSTRLITC
jgi:hypothetical protein